MQDEKSNRWRDMGAGVLRVTGQGGALLAALVIAAFGLCMGIEAAIGLTLPDGELAKAYVAFVAGVKAEASVHGDAVPSLVSVGIWVRVVRIVLVAQLLVAVGIVNQGWVWCRSTWREV